MGLLKLGQPEPLSYFSDDENSSFEQQMHVNWPGCDGKPGCEKGGSVSPSWVTAYSMFESFLFSTCFSRDFEHSKVIVPK